VRYYVRAEIERFLRAVDRALKRPTTVIIIGGGAAALKYRIDDPTTDIDTFNALRRAQARNRCRTKGDWPGHALRADWSRRWAV
jgi:hypothetical protein